MISSREVPDTKLDSTGTCSVTGLPILRRPEWTDIDLGEGYSVTFKSIGDRIILSVPKGKAKKQSMENLFRERAKVLEAMLGPDEPFFELKDYSGIQGRPSMAARDQFTKGMQEDKERIIGFIGYHAPLSVRLAINVGKKLHSAPFPMFIVKDYETAVREAAEALKDQGFVKERYSPKIITSADWSLELDGFSARFEIIDGDIFHSVAAGIFEERHVAPIFRIHEKMFNPLNHPEGPYYFVLGVTEIKESSRKARKLYTDSIKEWYKEHPFEVYIFYGINRFLRAAINIASPLAPFKVRMVKDLDSALRFINEEKSQSPKPSPLPTARGLTKEPHISDQTQQYVDELLHFLGSINWETDGFDYSTEIGPSHPFSPVFDAIELVKNDLDDLLEERKKAVKTLKESEEKYRTILESIEEVYFEVDLAGNFTFFNDSLSKILGYPKDELVGKNNRDYMTPESSEKIYKLFNQIHRTGDPIKKVDYEIIRKDGSHGFHELSASLMRDQAGQPIGFRGVARDITERKQAEEALRESEEKYRTILENIEDGYYEVDIAGNFTFFNDSICRILGYSKDELIGMNNQQYTDKETANKVYQTYKKVYATGKPAKGFEYEIIRKDGAKGYIESSVSPIRDPEGKTIGFRGIARDIAERKQAEALQQEKIKAEASSQAKSEFLANMSHEIRTPLTGIIGMTELAMETDLDDNQRDIFHTINKEASSLHGLINEILDFSKIEAGKLELDEIPFDLRVTIEDVAKSIAVRAQQKGLEFISFLSPDVPSRLIGDPGRLRQILLNLIGNALKFTNEGEIYIRGERAEELGDRVKIRFFVKDTGIGIPKDKQATIFESFTQADGSTTRQYGGTGLGTTISKQFAELMGGEIRVESEEGKGSTFWFTAVFAKQRGQEAILVTKEVDLSDLRVLVVDDNRTNRFILTEYLKSWGCLPVEATGGKEALDILRDSVSSIRPFNLILTDFQMPEMNGLDLAKEIRKTEVLKGIPIILLTSAGRRGDAKSCKGLGIEGYLTKPIRRDELHEAILSVLGLSRGEEMEIAPELVTRHTIAEKQRGEVQILLVEDYPTNQQVAMRHLYSAGYQVDLVENGQQAVEAVKRKDYDLILMDIQMPVMDGYEATKVIRDWEKSLVTGSASGGSIGEDSINDKWQMTNDGSVATRVPIVAMTAHAIKGDREKCLEAGMDDYIAKPLRRKELLAMVDKWTKSIDDCQLTIDNCEDETRSIRSEAADNCQSSIVNSQSKEAAPMDFDKALEEFEGDRKFLMDVLEGFLDNVRVQIGSINKAISDGDTEVVRREAHSIKGGAANLCADELSKIAFQLENIGKSGVLEGGIEVLERLEKEFSRLDVYVRDR